MGVQYSCTTPTMVRIQIKQKQEGVSIEEESATNPTDYTTLRVWERVDRKKFSLVRGFLLVGTAILMVMLVSRIVWTMNLMKQKKNGLVGSIEIVEMDPTGFGHEVDLSVTCTFETGAAPWTKLCTCSGIFHCGCVLEVTQCMRAGGCANICFQKQKQEIFEIVL